MDINSRRFISAYNKIDKALRQVLSLKPSIPFSDVVRRASSVLIVVKKHEDDLYAYARLRNAIVHSATDDYVIAEPHNETVEKIEALAALILVPPRAIDYAKRAQVLVANEPLLNACLTMSQNDYSNMPVLSGDKIIGVMTNKLLVKAVSKLLTQKHDNIYDYMSVNSVASALSHDTSHYKILKADATVDEVLTAYSDNPKLQIVILMDLKTNKIAGIITTGDVSRLYEVME